MNPTKVLNNLLPKTFNWIKEVKYIEYEGLVSRYTNNGISYTADEEYDLYEILLEIDPLMLPEKTDSVYPKKIVIYNTSEVREIIGRDNLIALLSFFYEINQLMTIDCKYDVKFTK